MNDSHYRFSRSTDLFHRAAKVIPGGIYGTKTPGFVVPGAYPYFIDRAEGCRFWDVDGNEYIDYLCGYGSMILGYGNPGVTQAVTHQLPKGYLLNQPGSVMVELAEKLVAQIEGMEWAVFALNGSDTTDLAVNLAKVYTGKRGIVMAEGAYHGTGNWCSSNTFPILDGRRDVHTFGYNDLSALRRIFSDHRGHIAAIILTPYHHRAFDRQLMPHPELYATVRELCDTEGAAFIMDDIRANFRLDLHGSHVHFGADPDFVCMGKCLTNGYPLAVLMGRRETHRVAGRFFITGTYWTSVAPMKAAVACLDEMNRLDILAHMNRIGSLLADGLRRAGRDSGLKVAVTGPPTIPFLSFDDDPDLYSNQVVCAEMTRRGVYVHPHHNWFVSHAHTEDDVHKTLEVARTAMRILAEKRNDPAWPRNTALG